MIGVRSRLMIKLRKEFNDTTTEMSAWNKYIAECNTKGDTKAAAAARPLAREARKRVKELVAYIDWLTHLIEN